MKASLTIGAGMACLWLAAAIPALAQESYVFSLPAQPLADSLTAAGVRARVNVVFSPSAVEGRRAVALQGRYSLDGALDRLLAGSGLDYSRTSGGSYIIKPAVSSTRSVPSVAEPVPPPITADAPYVPLLIVRGYRNSLLQSIKVKRAFSGISESVVAEDLTKFPDNNLAEALQRVPGVAIARDQGEGRAISVRGLGPDFTRVDINGIEAQAATDGLSYGVNKGRGFDFNVFLPELFGRVDVRKTTSADQAEGSLGASVNLLTPKPFDKKGLVVAGGFQRSYNDLSRRDGTRMTGLISNTFDGDRLGVLVSAAYAETPLEIQGINSGGWNQGTADGGFCKPTTGTGGLCDVPAAEFDKALAAYEAVNDPQIYHPRFYRYTDSIGMIRRLGVTASLQWRPSPRTSASADIIYARMRTLRTDYYLEAIGFSRGAAQGGKPETVPRQVEIDADGRVVYGVFDNVDMRSEVTRDNFGTEFIQGSFQLRHQFSEALSLTTIAGLSLSRFENYEELTAQIDRFNVDGYSIDLRQGGQLHPSISYGFDVGDPASWYFGPRVTQAGGTGSTGPELRLRPNYQHNDFDSLRTTLSYVWLRGLRFDLGLELKRYSYMSIGYRFDLGEVNFPSAQNGLGGLTQTFCGLKAVAPPPGTPRCWLVPDLDAFARAYDLFADTGRTRLSATNGAARGMNQSVAEDDAAIFAQFRFRTTWLGRPLAGDVGIRQVRTRQSSLFYSTIPVTQAGQDDFVRTRVQRVYNDTLPSLNMALSVSDKSVARLSMARVMSRPPLSSIAAATVVSVNGANRQVSTGNPMIDPIRANSYDLAYEWYPAPETSASASLFYKDISNYIQSLTYIAPYATTGLPASLLQYTSAAVTDDFHISNVVNTRGGWLRGAELNYQTVFRQLPGAWSGLGMKLSYTYVVSRINYENGALPGTVTRNDLINLSRNAYNVTGFYEFGRVQVRISSNYRDRYLSRVPGTFNTDSSGVDPSTYWDFASSYRITPRLTLSLEALNLSNAQSVTWDRTDAHLISGSNAGGRQIYLGLRYRR